MGRSLSLHRQGALRSATIVSLSCMGGKDFHWAHDKESSDKRLSAGWWTCSDLTVLVDCTGPTPRIGSSAELGGDTLALL